MRHCVPFGRQRRPVVGVLRMCWLLPGSFDCFCCPHTSVHRPSIACLAVFLRGPGALFLHALSRPSTMCPFPPHGFPPRPSPAPLWDTDACARRCRSAPSRSAKPKSKKKSSSVTCHRCLSLQQKRTPRVRGGSTEPKSYELILVDSRIIRYQYPPPPAKAKALCHPPPPPAAIAITIAPPAGPVCTNHIWSTHMGS